MQFLFNIVKTESIVGMVTADTPEDGQKIVESFLHEEGSVAGISEVRKSFETRVALGDRRPAGSDSIN